MNIYVGNLPRTVSEDALKQHFEQFGKVASVKIIKDKLTGEGRGFAFLEMPEAAEAEQAISQMNGRELEGRKLTVNEARQPEARGPRPGGNRFGGSGPRSSGNGGGWRNNNRY